MQAAAAAASLNTNAAGKMLSLRYLARINPQCSRLHLSLLLSSWPLCHLLREREKERERERRTPSAPPARSRELFTDNIRHSLSLLLLTAASLISCVVPWKVEGGRQGRVLEKEGEGEGRWDGWMEEEEEEEEPTRRL